MLAKLLLALLCFTFASASLSDSLMVDFQVSCGSALCSDTEVSSLITQLQSQLSSTNIYLVQVWSHEVTLLLCSEDNNLLQSLIELDSLSAQIENIRPSNHCLYVSI